MNKSNRKLILERVTQFLWISSSLSNVVILKKKSFSPLRTSKLEVTLVRSYPTTRRLSDCQVLFYFSSFSREYNNVFSTLWNIIIFYDVNHILILFYSGYAYPEEVLPLYNVHCIIYSVYISSNGVRWIQFNVYLIEFSIFVYMKFIYMNRLMFIFFKFLLYNRTFT